MKHFLDFDSLTREDILTLIERAAYFKASQKFAVYSRSPIVTLFYENSTRTRVSFELAAKYLSMPVINFNLDKSSAAKGEQMEDTILNLAAMGIQFFVVRHSEAGMPQYLAEKCGLVARMINAGDGARAHPSQALLDMMTILEKKPTLSELKIAIVGNISHSRVAQSFQQISERLGVGQLMLVAPRQWQPQSVYYGQVTGSLQEGLTDADVVMCLRVQHERLREDEQLDLSTYRKHYGITKTTIGYAKPEAIIMHPGPINRGVEIDSEVADGAQSVILEQVRNGIFARMAILDKMASE